MGPLMDTGILLLFTTYGILHSTGTVRYCGSVCIRI
jgi:hypothetical protein